MLGGVDLKNHKIIKEELKKLREEKAPVAAIKPTQEELLSQILAELKKQNEKIEPQTDTSTQENSENSEQNI